jgi:flagellar biosynthesis protein FlhA
LGDFGSSNKNPDSLTEFVRERLSRTIIKNYLDAEGVLPVITLTQGAEKALQEGLRQTEGGIYLSLNPAVAQKLVSNINTSVEGAATTSGQPVLLASPMVRSQLAQLLMRFLPNVPVLSQGEIPADTRLQSVGTAGID